MEKEKGLSLYLALIIMSILLAIVLGTSTILVSQLKIIRGVESSVIALYAAETGIEGVLVDKGDPTLSPILATCFDENNTCPVGEAEYYVQVLVGGAGACPSTKSFCIQSVGAYGNVKRALQVSY